MRKLLLILFIGLIILGSCNDKEYFYHNAVNHSSKTVTVNFHRGTGDIVLAPNETKEIALLKGDGEFGINYYSPDKRVSVSYSGSRGICYFYDLPAYSVSILNFTGIEGTLSADGWMEDIVFSADTTVQTDAGWSIYTGTPNFTALLNGNLPVSVLYLFADDTFKVTIGN